MLSNEISAHNAMCNALARRAWIGTWPVGCDDRTDRQEWSILDIANELIRRGIEHRCGALAMMAYSACLNASRGWDGMTDYVEQGANEIIALREWEAKLDL